MAGAFSCCLIGRGAIMYGVDTTQAAHGCGALTGVDETGRVQFPGLRLKERTDHVNDDLHGAHPDLMRRGTFRGVDLAALAKRLWRLGAMHASGPVPTIRWRAYTGRGYAWGVAYTGHGRVTMRIGDRATVEDAAEVLLHELVHMACPTTAHHGELFCRRLIGCAREAFGLTLDTAALLRSPATRGCRAYTIDAHITRAMMAVGVAAMLRGEVATVTAAPAPAAVDPVPAPPVPPPPTAAEVAARRAAAMAAIVESRAAHARTKLAEWERRRAAAVKIAAKWRGKVRYYDQRQEAAKRCSPRPATLPTRGTCSGRYVSGIGARATTDSTDVVKSTMPAAVRRVNSAHAALTSAAKLVDVTELPRTGADRGWTEWYGRTVTPALKALASDERITRLLPPAKTTNEKA